MHYYMYIFICIYICLCVYVHARVHNERSLQVFAVKKKEERTTERITPVSYTHLDVYKRQSLHVCIYISVKLYIMEVINHLELQYE